MMVTWVTLAYTNYTIVEYNKAGFPLTLQASGNSTKFTDGGSEHRVLYIHRVKITGLVPDQMYGKKHNLGSHWVRFETWLRFPFTTNQDTCT